MTLPRYAARVAPSGRWGHVHSNFFRAVFNGCAFFLAAEDRRQILPARHKGIY